MPDTELALEDVGVDPERLAEYCRVCGFTMRAAIPATYPHILAFPLHMALLTQGDFPFPAIGLVHVQNRIEQRRPIEATEKLEIRVSAGELQPHPKGKTFALLTSVSSGGEEVWVSESINLRRGEGSESASDSGPSFDPDLGAEAEWRLPGDLGRSYGGVSGDRNPIHMYGLTAKALGLPPPDRARHVDEGPLRRGARTAPARRVRGRGRLQAPDPPAVEGRVHVGHRRR